MNRIEVECLTGSVTTIELTQRELDQIVVNAPTKAQLKNKELKERAVQYKEDNRELQLSWLSALVADGATEVDKKAALLIDIEDLKTEYTNDVAAIKLKYQ